MIDNLMRACILTASCLVGLASATSAARETKGINGPNRAWRLAFVRNDDIWVANGDGSGQTRIIRNGARPCWSPDRKHIAFVRDDNIWIADPNGQGQRKITAFPREREYAHNTWDGDLDVDLTWDPLADRIMFSHPESYRITKIGKTDSTILRGSSLFEIPWRPGSTHDPDRIYDLLDQGAAYHFSNYNHPAWSRDGQLCVYTCNGDIRLCTRIPLDKNDDWRRGISRYLKMEVKRLAATAVVDAPTWHGSRENLGVTRLAWSPDASFVVYGISRQNGSGSTDVHLLQFNHNKEYDKQEGEKQIQDRTLAQGIDPCVSPDGKFIVYDGATESTSLGDLHVITADGWEDHVLIKHGEQPAW